MIVVLAIVLAGPAVGQDRPQPSEVRHSGRILEIAPDGSAIVLEELVTWTAPGTGVVTRSIQLTPHTSIRLVERTARWDGDRTAMPGWDTQVIDVGSLRPGDFVTVTADDERRSVAVALEVVRPKVE